MEVLAVLLVLYAPDMSSEAELPLLERQDTGGDRAYSAVLAQLAPR